MMRAAAFALLALAACGGKATVDGGAGGSGGSSEDVTSTSAPSSGTTGPGSLCAEACALMEACFEAGFDCVASCRSSPGGCITEQDAFLSCIVSTPATGQCGMPPACTGALQDYLRCRGTSVSSGGCASTDGQCSCQYVDALTSFIEVSCQVGPDPNCACRLDGHLIGACTSQNPLACDLTGDCCGAVIYVPGLP